MILRLGGSRANVSENDFFVCDAIGVKREQLYIRLCADLFQNRLTKETKKDKKDNGMKTYPRGVLTQSSIDRRGFLLGRTDL